MRRLRWGFLGLGRAGRARLLAMARDPRCEVAGAWRGQPEAHGLRRFDDPDALMAACEALVVCTPDALHAGAVRQALGLGLHVVCEFPLAGSMAEARALFSLAEARGRVLHVEHIELLSPATRALAEACAGRTLRVGHLRFTSPGGGWLDDPALAFGVAHRSVARLHRLRAALGPLHLQAVHARGDRSLHATLAAAGGTITLLLDQAPGLSRKHELLLTFEDGARVAWDGRRVQVDGREVPQAEVPSLFALDHALAMDRILHGAPPHPDPDQVLEVLGLVDDLASRGLSES